MARSGVCLSVTSSQEQIYTAHQTATPSLFHLEIIAVFFFNSVSVSDLLLAAVSNMSGVFIKEEIKDTEETETVSAFSIADSHSR